jgi:hypothetical protein
MNVPRTLPDGVLDHHVDGHHIGPGPLSGLLGTAPTLLVFLRHYG